MDRTEVIQTFIDRRALGSYLEIGIGSGRNFLRIRCRGKEAVDPAPPISALKRARWWLRNRSNRGSRIHRMTSDDFFAAHGARLATTGLDIAFVDGLHTWEQALRDVENCLALLRPGGVVLMHDCSPPSAAAAIRARSPDEARRLTGDDWDGMWCGDVFKAVLHLRSQRPDLRACVLDCDRGIGVVQPAPAVRALRLTVEEVGAATYAELAAHREEWLDLRPAQSLDELARA